MSRQKTFSLLVSLIIAATWAVTATTALAGFHGHRRYPTGNSTTYPNATPHGGFSSSNGYYSGRSRIVDVPAPPPPAAPPKPAPLKPVPAK